MPKRKAWKGDQPQSPAEARRILLDVARDCIDRLGPSRAGLSDVATAAGVTRQTVYRYFESVEDLFHSAAVLASGGFRERMRAAASKRPTPAERMVECVIFCVREIPEDLHLNALSSLSDQLSVSAALRLSFVQEEMFAMAGGDPGLDEKERDELAEILLRILHSFLADPGEERTEEELRAFLVGWLAPMIDARRRTG